MTVAAEKSPLLSTLPPTLRARVVIVEDPQATAQFQPKPEPVRLLVNRGLTNLTGHASVSAAWRSLVSTQDVVGIKVFASPGPTAGTRPVVAQAVAQGLLEAGIPPHHIVIWDRQLDDLRRAGFVDMARRLGVRVAGAVQAGWDEKVFYDMPLLGHLVYSDLEFNRGEENVGRKSFMTKLVTQDLTKIINLTPLLNHNSAGVCGNLFSLTMGSLDNTLRFEGDAARLTRPVPEIYAMAELGDHVVLNIVDALIAQYQGEHVGRLHYSTALNQIRLGTDPVALDVLSIQELDHQRQLKGTPTTTATNVIDLYRIASVLEIGVSDPRLIQVETIRF
jgi:hypothetical protein